MSLKNLLSHLPSVVVVEDRTDICSASVKREHFTGALDELVNCRTLAKTTTALYSLGLALSHLYVTDERKAHGVFVVHALLHDDTAASWLHLFTELPGDDPTYPSATLFIMNAQWFERYNADMFGVIPLDHPDLRRLAHHANMPFDVHPLRKDFLQGTELESEDIPYPVRQVTGEGVHEIGIGPVHHRVAESVHYRLSTTGERIMALEVKPFFKHKGVEKLVEGRKPIDALPFLERLGGDSAISHALAFSQAIESVEETVVSQRSRGIRSFLNECERVIMHVEDLSNIAGIGAGYNGMKRGFLLKERLMTAAEAFCGNRFLRGLIVPGGIARDVTDKEVEALRDVFVDVIDDMTTYAKRALHSDGLRDRLELCGVLKKDVAKVYGAVGLVARASGVDRDVRRDHPYAAYDRFEPRVITHVSGDAFARFKLRADELIDSRRLLIDLSAHLGGGEAKVPCHPALGLGVSAAESGRGEMLYAVHMKDGLLERVAIRGASFSNWPLLHELIPTSVLSDFPLCCRSLGLSVAGSDL